MNAASLFGQAAGLALLAAIYPPATLIAALYLASERPGRTTVAYVAGGLATVTAVGIVALIAIRAGGLSHLHHHQTRYGLRLGLGLLALIAAAVMFARRRKAKAADDARQPDQPGSPGSPGSPGTPGKRGKPKKAGLIERLTEKPRPLAAFAVGAVMFGPSLTFIAAVEVVATARAGIADTIAVMAMIIILAVAFAWLPLVAFLVAPGPTARTLRTFEAWLRRHGRTVLMIAIAAVGVVLTIQGITGLA